MIVVCGALQINKGTYIGVLGVWEGAAMAGLVFAGSMLGALPPGVFDGAG
jgi:hypothetical protein